MPPLTPGKTYVFAGDMNIYWALLGTKLPGWNIPFGGAWPTGWNQIYDTTGAVLVHPRNPREEIFGEFHDLLGSMRANAGGGGGGGGGAGGGGRGGGAGGGNGPGVAIQFEILTPEYELWRNINSMSKTVIAAQTAVRELKVTTGATASGSLSVTPPGGPLQTVAVLNTDTTAAQIATKVAAATFTGWTVAVKSGATDTVVFTASTAGLKQGTPAFSGAATGVAATWSTVAPGHWGTTTTYVDSNVLHHIMIGFELVPQSGSAQSGFLPQTNLRRGFGMECENVAQPEDIWGRSGRASLLTPNVQFECLPTTIDPTLLVGTGLESAADPAGRFFYADTPLTDPAL